MSAAGDMLLAGDALLLSTHSTETITIAGTPYTGFVMESSLGTYLEYGGFAAQDFHRIAIPRANITTIPSEGATVTFRAQTLYIIRVTRDDAEAPIVLEIGPETSGKRS
jgi:hypothetical protein